MRWLSGLDLDSGLAWRSFEPGPLVRLSLGRSLVVVPVSLFYFPPTRRRHPHQLPPAFTSKPTNDLRRAESAKSVRIWQQSIHVTTGRSFLSSYFILPDVHAVLTYKLTRRSTNTHCSHSKSLQQKIFIKKMSYFDTVDPVTYVKERCFWRYIVHNNHTVSFANVLSTDTAVFFLSWIIIVPANTKKERWKRQKWTFLMNECDSSDLTVAFACSVPELESHLFPIANWKTANTQVDADRTATIVDVVVTAKSNNRLHNKDNQWRIIHRPVLVYELFLTVWSTHSIFQSYTF